MRELLSDYLTVHQEAFSEHTMVGLFRQTVEWYPDKEAVSMKEDRLTYRELDRLSDRIAYYLVEEEHIGPNEYVGVSTGRGVAAAAAVLGIWKAGAAFVVVDPSYPDTYNKNCIEGGNVRVCIDAAYCDKLRTAPEQEAWAQPFPDRSEREAPALILFTSGSTGKPKGVRILQRNLTASISNFHCLPLRSDDEYASLANMAFIAAVYDFCASMALGCSLRLLPDEIRKNIHQIAQFYIDNKCTIAFLPPHMAVKYIENDENSPLRILLVGSEPTRNLKKRPYEIINVYASSEACAIISYYHIQDARMTYPIGKLVPALRGYVVTDEGEQAAVGEEGELWLAGPQIFDEYVNLPKINAEKFAPNPFDEDPAFSRVFKTSDMVRMGEDGNLEYVGRKDHMYKIRGFRVEICGVEAFMQKFPGITGACLTCFTDEGGTNILFGYYTADREIDHSQLRAYLLERVPAYAVPTALIRMEKFPYTLSGKVNRKGFVPPPELNDHKKLAELYY